MLPWCSQESENVDSMSKRSNYSYLIVFFINLIFISPIFKHCIWAVFDEQDITIDKRCIDFKITAVTWESLYNTPIFPSKDTLWAVKTIFLTMAKRLKLSQVSFFSSLPYPLLLCFSVFLSPSVLGTRTLNTLSKYSPIELCP